VYYTDVSVVVIVVVTVVVPFIDKLELLAPYPSLQAHFAPNSYGLAGKQASR
jgi:hypothetical protein